MKIYHYFILFACVVCVHSGRKRPRPEDDTTENFNRPGCTVKVGDLSLKQPLFLDETTNELLQPGPNGLQFDYDERVRVACPVHGKNHLTTGYKSSAKILICRGGDQFESVEPPRKQNIIKALSGFECEKYPQPGARDIGRKCAGSRAEVEIGFELETGFLILNRVCFDTELHYALYSEYTLSRCIGQRKSNVPRCNFRVGQQFKGLKPTISYSKNSQGIVDNYLIKGHLAPKADFVYPAEQRATFYFINASPQYEKFNNGNWKVLEDNIRSLAASKGVNLKIFTGVWTKDGSNKHLNNNIPIPDIFWKVIYDQENKKALGVVGTNNPTGMRNISTDICRQVTWIKWENPNDASKGYSYCCEVNDLRRTVTYIPDLSRDPIGLLL